jgi:hypothetical protein
MINSRDQSLVKLLSSYGFLTSEQIKKILFQEVDKRTMLRRLRKLKKKKILNRFESAKGGAVLWALAPSQVAQIDDGFVIKNINRNTLAHDLLVNDVRFKLEQKNIGKSWTSSHYFRFKMSEEKKLEDRLKDTIPDWLVTIEGKMFALEVELNFKSKARMRDIFSLYQNKKSISHLWYFVPSEKIRQKILKCAEPYLTYRGRGWVKVTLLSELDQV